MTLAEFTTNEAGYVLEQPVGTINKAIDTGLIRAGVGRRTSGAIAIRLLGRQELRFLKLAGSLSRNLTAGGQRRVYQAMRSLADTEHEIRIGVLTIELGSLDRLIESRIDRLMTLRQSVTALPAGDLVIQGTEVPVYLVAGLAKGQTVAEILEDFPSLTVEQVETAIEYVKAYPKKGRPYPVRSFKRMIADLDPGEPTAGSIGQGPRLIGT